MVSALGVVIFTSVLFTWLVDAVTDHRHQLRSVGSSIRLARADVGLGFNMGASVGGGVAGFVC